MLRDLLDREGVLIGLRHIATSMKHIGTATIYRRRNTSRLPRSPRIYPYLLRSMKVGRRGKPEIFDSDQGHQCTSGEFTGVLPGDEITISKDRHAARQHVCRAALKVSEI